MSSDWEEANILDLPANFFMLVVGKIAAETEMMRSNAASFQKQLELKHRIDHSIRASCLKISCRVFRIEAFKKFAFL